MSIYVNAFVMLVATISAFVVLAKLVQAIRLRRITLPWRVNGLAGPLATPPRLAIEQTCALDAKRRLVLIRCEEQRVLLLTGGPADLVIPLVPTPPSADAVV
ncbi:MAG TPA: hypothetical protein VGF36_09815 [Rhodopila sp.]|jgi:flagellar protein FliO/FliZ